MPQGWAKAEVGVLARPLPLRALDIGSCKGPPYALPAFAQCLHSLYRYLDQSSKLQKCRNDNDRLLRELKSYRKVGPCSAPGMRLVRARACRANNGTIQVKVPTTTV